MTTGAKQEELPFHLMLTSIKMLRAGHHILDVIPCPLRRILFASHGGCVAAVGQRPGFRDELFLKLTMLSFLKLTVLSSSRMRILEQLAGAFSIPVPNHD